MKVIIKKLIVMLIISVFLISTIVATVHAVSIPKTDKQIEAKEKVAKIKVTFNANGGKIGSKKTVTTNVKKGAKLKKLAATPKRSGFTFQGWFSKKSGGKKITKNTKVSKKVTFYAKWKKKARTLNTEEKKLVGAWSTSSISPGFWTYIGGGYEQFSQGTSYVYAYKFNSDGTWMELNMYTDKYFLTTGNWAVTTKNKIRLTNLRYTAKGSVSNPCKDKIINDRIDLYKIRINSEGKQQITFHSPSFYTKGSEQYKWTIDEYIEKSWPTWHTKQ